MAYDSLKALIRQYIKTNGEQEITGQILQNVLVEMVNQYPSTDGYATQSWVTSQGYATTSQLAGYLPLTGGTLSGNLTVLNASMSVVTAGSSATSYTATITGSGIEAQMLRSGTPINSRMVLNYGGLTFYDQNVAGTTITLSSITSGSFIKSGGTSAQFLKADGSVDSNTYVTASALSGYATQSWVTTQLGSYLPLTGGTLTGSIGAGSLSEGMYTLNETGISFSNGVPPRYINELSINKVGSGYEIVFSGRSGQSVGTTITSNTVTSGSFIKNGGTSAQFLKADGSVDSNTYVTASALSGYATQSWVNTQLGSYNPTSNFKTINNQSIIGTGNINIEGGGGTVYDAEVEYLENSSASQLIDTNYIPQGNGVEIGGSFYYMGYYTSNQWEALVYATYVNETTNTFRIIRNQSTNNSLLLYHNRMAAGGGTTVSVSLNTKYDFVFNDNGYTFNGVQYARTTSSGAANTDSLKMFYGGHIRLYSFYIKKDGVLVHDFIPVRVGQVGYLYDKVSGELFGNSGTGDFVLGQDTVPGGGLPYLPLTGGTITGNLTMNGNINMGSKTVYFNYGNAGAYLFCNSSGFNIQTSSLYISTEAGTTLAGGLSMTTGNLVVVNGKVGIGTLSQSYKLHVTGQVGATGFVNTSDLRKKTIIGDVPMNLYNVANAPLFKFTWNDEKEYSGHHIGSAAQYWQTILPELVIQGSDADMTLAMQYDVIALASAITVAKTVVNHEERIILLERENEALKKEIADLKSA